MNKNILQTVAVIATIVATAWIIPSFSFVAQAKEDSSLVSGSWKYWSAIDEFDDTTSYWARTINDGEILSISCGLKERYNDDDVLGDYYTLHILLTFSELISGGKKDVKYRIDKRPPYRYVAYAVAGKSAVAGNVRDNYPVFRDMLQGNKIIMKLVGEASDTARFDLDGIIKATTDIRKVCDVAVDVE